MAQHGEKESGKRAKDKIGEYTICPYFFPLPLPFIALQYSHVVDAIFHLQREEIDAHWESHSARR